MRFTEYLANENIVEAPQMPSTPWSTRQTAKYAGARPAERLAQSPQEKAQAAKKAQQKTTQQQQKTAHATAMTPFQELAAKDRTEAMEMITLLGSMYQTKRRNPAVQMTLPKMVTQSKNRQTMEKLFNLAKDKDLPQLAKMSQEIKSSAAAPGAGQPAPPAGAQNVPQTPGQTAAEKSTLQKLYNMITSASRHVSPAGLMAASKKLAKAAQKAKPNPPADQAAPLPTGGTKPVVTQG